MHRWRFRLVLATAISTLLAGTGLASATPSAPAYDVTRQLRDLEASSHRHIGAFALDTATGKAVGYRAHELFPTLSTFKAAEAAAVLDRARRSDPGLMERRIHWTPDREVPLDGSPVNGHGATGMTVAELASAAVTVSDNTAANLLFDQIGGPAGLTRYYRSLGDPISRSDRLEPGLNDWAPGQRHDTTTPAAMGRDLASVAVGHALAPADRDVLNGWLRGSKTGTKRIRAGLPPSWTVGDKTGTYSAIAGANDIAVAWPSSGKPLIFVVYTYGEKGAPLDDKTVADTARILAHEVTGQP
ncbi:class A beta-lactamase [Amycolatopsis sp. CA-230715]|uniref:class A beta-lactamase n=1 Tax=Amycolatopsis sp. CA-230715 TaxID=2745196 RepID=UPI001C00D5F1|nr:class A beta-lactamase [Amycolatopsis sp. CA-230715]QWF79375.1 Imipenem-hydrolyzing beta-lactamase [Amycolatopsis sp. CA-230715]